MNSDEKIPIPEFKISVRNIVEFILRWGDINNAGMKAPPDLQEGTKIHRRIQKKEEKTGIYRSEVRLSESFSYTNFRLTVQGVADGIIFDEPITVDEIKSTSMPIELIDEDFSRLHRAQAKFYAYMYAKQNGLKEIKTRLTYFNLDTEEIKYFPQEHTLAELEDFVYRVCDEYSKWIYRQIEADAEFTQSAKDLSFPFEEYRQGQRELAGTVYRTIRDKETLYAQAPTGIGKTVSMLFSAIKAKGEGMGEKIFYLTAKTVNSRAVDSALKLMHKKGLRMRNVFLCAKEKVCKYENQCKPESCPYAKGHFDRINEAVFDVLTNEYIITTEILAKYAEKHVVCPFELALDTATWCDGIVGDYNYAFDPSASLKRFFTDGGDYVLLCDEAHNLPQRAREMYSAELEKTRVLEAMRPFKTKNKKIYASLKKLNNAMLNFTRGMEKDSGIITEEPTKIYNAAVDFCRIFSTFLSEEGNDKLKNETADFYFDTLNFVSVFENLDKNYRCCAEKRGKFTTVKLFCVDPAARLSETLDMCRASIFFSATLLPPDYFRNTIGMKNRVEEENSKAPIIRLPSPFPKENLKVIVCPFINTKYLRREESYEAISELIFTAVQKTGNYFAFFPSFAYMNEVYAIFTEKHPEIKTIIQRTSLTEEQRDCYLEEFDEDPTETLVAFAVSGGIFSEGVDLVGTRLSGAVIIGVGLPQICFERNVIKEFYDKRDNSGYGYAYLFPGFNRVMQAAGRVIRSETDKGFVILTDSRYTTDAYRSLFPPEWKNFKTARNISQMNNLISEH